MPHFPRRALLVGWLLAGIALTTGELRARESTEAGKKYALLIGVSEYGSLRSLPGARNDVVAMRTALTSGGFEASDVTLMTNGSAGRLQPTSTNIGTEVKELTRKAREDDTVLLALAGHGFQIKGESGHYFCAADSNVSQPETMVPLMTIFKDLAQCKARRKVLMVDACRNDPFAEGELGKPWAKKVESQLKLELPAEGNIVAMFSCSQDQSSNEDIKLGHGVFFYYVIRGLLGEAAGPDGIVTVDSLLAYARPQVQDHVRKRFKETQVPLVRTIGEVPLIPLLRPAGETKGRRLLQEAQKAVQDGRKEEASAKYTQAIAANPRELEAYMGRGKLYSELKKYDQAYEDFSEALNLDRKSAEAFELRGWVSRRQKDINSALRDLRKAMELNPQSHEVANRIGCIYADDKNDQKEAIVYYNEAIKLNPGFALAYFYRAFSYRSLEKNEEAMRDFDMAVSLDPHSEMYRQYRADFASYLDRFEVAFKDGEKATQLADKGFLDPANQLGSLIESNTYIWQGDYYYARNNYEQSTLSYQRAVVATDRAAAGMARFNRQPDRNAMYTGNLQNLSRRIDLAAQRGDVGRYRAMTDRMIDRMPPAERQQFRRQQQQDIRDMRQERRDGGGWFPGGPGMGRPGQGPGGGGRFGGGRR